MGDVMNDRVKADQGLPSPVDANGAERFMLNRIPLTCAGRVMADMDLQARGIGQGLQHDFIQATDGRVAAPTIAGNIEARRVGIPLPAHGVPPALNTRHREFCGIMALSHIDEGFIGGDVVDAIRGSLAPY